MPTDRIHEFPLSTILEDVFQYFDEELTMKRRRYRKLEREKRLRAATIIFVEMGLASLAEAQPLPMLVPTKDLMDALGTSRLTTLVEPLLMPSHADCDRIEVRRYYEYAKDLSRSLKDDLPGYVAVVRPAMGVLELGWAEHRREDGRLCWSITRLGNENIENGTVAKFGLSDEPYGRN